ncbi:MAG: hypothetical protein E7562_05595 [Ruminococcaceae bacterium]|nr:hypothetical protein [Oscillospiraceae bacterium]
MKISKKTVKYCPESSGTLIGLPYPYTTPCVSDAYQELYYWDTYFTNVGLYESNSEKQYVNYVRPQEHGNHNKTKMLSIGKMKFGSKGEFEFNVSNYSADVLYKAEHTDELTCDQNTYLRVDYKVSGIGSNSCGPELKDKYRFGEKNIKFDFFIEI